MYRAFFALPEMTSKKGEPTGAIHGFMSMLLKLLSYNPTHMAVAFDMHSPTFRHLEYPEYKAGRAPTPPELVAQFESVKGLLCSMGIRVIECEGYEADDILGTLARQAGAADMECLLVTGDKDALQLIDSKTHVIFTKKGASDITEYDEALLMEKYGLTPNQMIDLKGLMGDSSDNLPGIRGVGEKTALKLLEKYGSLEEALVRGAVEEKGALQRKLIESADSARMSYKLGTINTAAPIPVTLYECGFDSSKMSEALPRLNELQLRSIIQKLPEAVTLTAAPVQREFDVSVTEISTQEEAKELLNILLASEMFAISTEDGLSFAVNSDVQYDIRIGGTLLDAGLDEYDVYNILAPVLESDSIKKVVFDAKSLMHTLSRCGKQLHGLCFDGMIADYLLNAVNPAKTLSDLCAERGITAHGAAALMHLYPEMSRELHENTLYELYEQVEMPLIEVLYDMEKTGFYVDREILSSLGKDFADKKQDLEQQIYTLADCKFNIQSPKQLSEILFEKLKLPPPKQKTKYGYSTGADVLEMYEADFPIVKLILEYRFYSKLLGTFIDGMLGQINKKTGRIYTTFNQNVTATGRISSTEPNLQTIPTRTDMGREIRSAFAASPGNVLVDADYSQIELRVLAHMSADVTMKDAFLSGDDIHTRTASEVFGCTMAEVSRQQRSAAKAVNFGIVYGISEFGLAKQLGVSRKLAGEYIRRYLERYSGIDAFMHSSVENAEKTGYAVTLLGRRRQMHELHSSNFNTRAFGKRVAMNMPVQGTAADIIKIAMVSVYREMKRNNLRAKLILQIHDELIVDAPKDEAEQVKNILKNCMESAYKLDVPLTVDVNIGESWYETK